jgi:hypothetical protein
MNYRDENRSYKTFLLQCSKKSENFLMQGNLAGLFSLKHRILGTWVGRLDKPTAMAKWA